MSPARKGTTISSPSDPSRARRGRRRARPRGQREAAPQSVPADELEDWLQDPAPVPESPAEDPTPPEPTADGERTPPSPPSSTLADWTTPPASPRTGPAPTHAARTARTRPPAVHGPAHTSSLDDWVQGPRERQAEQEAEDAWSTSDAVSGTWHQEGGSVRSRPLPRHAADGTAPVRPGPTATDPPAPREPEAGRPRSRPAFRRELHGLRAVALGLVAVYHIWLGRVSGGVDVFLFLSAFFLTGTFVRRLESGRPLGIPRYWLHTFKRLLPPAAVVILLVLGATAAMLPASMWQLVMEQAVASTTYLQNALLVLQQVDYHARDAGEASPLQHFWSLSVQGQAFVVWPLLFLLVVRRARAGKAVRRPLIAIITVLGAASLTWSILSTQTQQQIAYFDTAARLWEFAAGSLLALALPLLDRLSGARRPEDGQAPRYGRLRAGMGWAGIAALLACGITVDVSTMFPGWIAIWPLAAAGAVVVAGHSGRRWGVDALLSTRPAAFVGDISYALYLVHWPILVLWLHHSGQERAGALDGLAVLTGSVLLAWLVTRAVDAPVRRSRWLEARPWRALTAIALSVALVVGAAGAWWLSLDTEGEENPPVAVSTAIPTDAVATETPAEILPHGYQLSSQWPDLPERCGGVWEPESSFHNVNCQQLLPAGSEVAGTLVVVGNSHSRQFIPALIPYAQEHDLQIVNLSMDACLFLSGVEASPYCSGYEQYVLDYVDAVSPDLVLTAVTRTTVGDGEAVPDGAEAAVQELLDRGIDVLGMRDTPRWEEDQYQCAEAVIDEGGTPADADTACGADRAEKYAEENPAEALAGLEGAGAGGGASLTLIDLSESICPRERCSPILGESYVYMDDDHLSRTFVEGTLTPEMTRLLAERVPEPAA